MNKNAIYGIYGASGFGREVLPLAKMHMVQHGLSLNNLLFIDDGLSNQIINGIRVVSYQDFLAQKSDEKYVSIAIADSSIRKSLFQACIDDGVLPWDVSHSNVVVMDAVDIDAGYILSPFVTITSNVRIGKSFHANIYSYVAHDCVIGDFVTFAPSVHCNGNVHVGNHAYIGTGAIIKQGTGDKPLVIGEGAVVGMGAVVTKSVPPGAVVVGNPAKALNRMGLGG